MSGLLDVLAIGYRLLVLYAEAIYRLVVRRRPRKDVRGRVVLVTGAGSGIGRQLARRLGGLGARLVLWDIDKAANDETARMLKDQGIEAHAQQCDVSNNADVIRKAQLSRSDVHGNVDILINNAGVMPCRELLDLSEEEIRRTIGVNTLAHFWTVREFLPDMISQQSGHIVTISSMAGISGAPMLADYCASKFGSVGFTESLHFELCRNGYNKMIRVSIVMPYLVESNLLEKVSDRVQVRSPFIKPLTVDDTADVIVDGILRDNFTIYIPRWASCISYIKMLMPQKVLEFLEGLGDTGFFPIHRPPH